MDEREGRDLGDDAPAEERGVGDEVAGDERSGRGAASEPRRMARRKVAQGSGTEAPRRWRSARGRCRCRFRQGADRRVP